MKFLKYVLAFFADSRKFVDSLNRARNAEELDELICGRKRL